MKKNNSFLEVIDEKSLKNLNEDERELIQIKMWNLLSYVTNRYTMGDSSSVPVETAESLLKSICFLLKREVKNYRVLEEEDLKEVLNKSYINIQKDIDKGKELLKKVIATSTGVDNISYNDTVEEIGEGFQKYDFRFSAHEFPCGIDCQLANPVSESLEGIDYINEYLRRLLFENKFCNYFQLEKIIGVLNSYCKDYKGLLINVFEPVLINAIGLDLLNNDIFELEVTEYQRKLLLNIFSSDIENKIINSAYNICKTLKIDDEFECKYVEETASSLVSRVEESVKNNNLDDIFLSFKYEEDSEDNIFVDNNPMDDEKLRDLIDEIRELRYTKDKITIIKNEVYSMADLIEILNNCLWIDEVSEFINSYGSEEIEMLKYYIKNNEINSDTAWEKEFIKLLKM